MKRLLTLFPLIFCFFCFTFPARAASEFDTSFHSAYIVKEDGETSVEHRIDIKNNLSHIYTTEYTISIGGSSLTSLEVTVDGKIVPFKEDSAGNITTLTISIPQPVIGKDQVLPILIKYQTQDLVEKYGSVLEVNIPRLSRANEASLYTRKIIVPSSLGVPEVGSPTPTKRSADESGDTVLEYTGYPSESITLLFGKSVTYKLSLTYLIKNPTLAEADTEIAIPPDTEYQKILLDSLDPRPISLKLDRDGNWLALYPLKSQEEKTVNATLYAAVYPVPAFPSLVSDLDSLTAAAKYWETKSSAVKTLSAKLKSPLNIYNYLVENMTYDYGRIKSGERLGAEKALEKPSSAICTEFTDSFVALARAAGIPAREINGYARTDNLALRPAGLGTDILHAWPEYYDRDKKTWLQIDPTWGKTTGGIDYFSKMDYSHITFAIHGRESAYPLPAGSYKSTPDESTLDISLASDVPQETFSYKEGRAGDRYTITNTGNVALRDYHVVLSDQSEHTIGYLPPYGTEVIASNQPLQDSLWEKIVYFFKNLFRRV